jgi:hypothetical protein
LLATDFEFNFLGNGACGSARDSCVETPVGGPPVRSNASDHSLFVSLASFD